MLAGSKWRIAIVFAFLASMVCVLLGTAAFQLFYIGLTDALDDELSALADELSTFVNLAEETADLEAWRKSRAKGGFKRMVSIGFYDDHGNPVDTYGDFVLPGVSQNRSEPLIHGQKLRLLSRKLEYKGNLVGWLQITIPTRARDHSVSQLLELMEITFPVAVLAFTTVGYFFAGWTIKPIEDTFASFKRFLADAGHELKTPLTIAKTHTEALEAELVESDAPSDRTQVIGQALSRMQQLVDDLMLLAQTESPRFLHLTKTSTNQIVSSVAEDFKEKCKSKGIEIRCDILADTTIKCDQECIRRAVSNLVENAWRYTAPGGKIILSAGSHQRHARITVEDNGIGIPANSLAHIFDRFYRIDVSRSRKDGGSGLGLAIVKGIVEAHGGTVSVNSQEGAGSKFTLNLPLP